MQKRGGILIKEHLLFIITYLAFGTLWAFGTGALLTTTDVFLGSISFASEYSMQQRDAFIVKSQFQKINLK